MRTGSVAGLLLELGFSPWHLGYRMLCQAIPRYREDRGQSITKELYPELGQRFGGCGGAGAERAIRYAVAQAWSRGRREVWEGYFPPGGKRPSNLHFIATVAEYLE